MPAEDQVLSRLAATSDPAGTAFLSPYHLAAAARLESLIARASIVPRLTMSYDSAVPGRRSQGGNIAAESTDSAASARQYLNRLAAALPADCWGVLFDICAMGKGLQDVETERRWPRRSAKLVLRIGLEQLATMFGLGPHQAGSAGKRQRGWLGQRLPLINRQESD